MRQHYQFMSRSKFYDRIKDAKIEREVEDVYNEGFSRYFKNASITHPYACDGFIETTTDASKNLRLLIEYKYDENFKTSADKAKVLAQVVYYLKQFELNGQALPNVVFVGDINECFVLQSNCLLPYLDGDFDWNIAPSSASKSNPQLVLQLSNDAEINPFVFVIDENFSFQNVANRIIDQSDNVQRYVRVTEHNIATIYDYFSTRVVRNATKIPANELVALFIGTITDQDNYYIHPKKNTVLVANGRDVDVDEKSFRAFFSVFKKDYSPSELHKFAEISDRLIEDTKRRRSGEFYTPTPFVDYAHKMLSEQLGDDWKEKYVVWDCCWGTGNLTRDYHFKELYASTLEPGELAIGEKYNQEATKFIFDFLNDSIDDLFGKHVPDGLLQAFKEDKPILFFINPPYGTASSGGANTNHKEGCSNTKVNEDMLSAKIGSCSQNLYAQFLYRITQIKNEYNLSNVRIGLFSPTLYLSGPSWKNFRKFFFSNFEFNNACTFQASFFADVSDSWGIAFSVWDSGFTQECNYFDHKTITLEEEEIKELSVKMIYNTDNLLDASNWIQDKRKNKKDIEIITAKSSLKISDTIKKVGDNYGYFINDANNIDATVKGVYFMTMPVSRHIATIEVDKTNYYKCTTLFSARKLIDKNWINSKDEYLAPNEQHEKWQEFVNDSIVYSLFHSSSNQSSLRNVEYKGKNWNIKNEFFWMPKNKIMELAEQAKLVGTYEEARTDNERFVYNKLQEIKLSAEAQAVLNKATELTVKSFPYRTLFNQEHPEYQILNWDCGWYQIKGVLNAYMQNELKEFSALFKQLSDKMRPLVYELGFLK